MNTQSKLDQLIEDKMETKNKNLDGNTTTKSNQNNKSTNQDNTKLLLSSIEKLDEENKVLSKTLRRVEEESVMLRELFNNANTELNNLKKPSLLVADIVSLIDDNKSIIKLPNGNKFCCYVAKDIKDLAAGDSVLVDQKTLNVVEKIEMSNNLDVEKYVIIEKPKESFKEIGGLKKEIN